METFNVGGTWVAAAPLDPDTLADVGINFRPADESFCLWVDPKDGRRLEMSWKEPAASIEEAAQQCKRALDSLLPQLAGRARLSEVTVTTDEGYWRTTSPDVDLGA